MSKPKLFISRVRQADGKWVVDPEPRTRKEAKTLEQVNRIMLGMTTQVWPFEEAKKQFPDVFA